MKAIAKINRTLLAGALAVTLGLALSAPSQAAEIRLAAGSAAAPVCGDGKGTETHGRAYGKKKDGNETHGRVFAKDGNETHGRPKGGR